MNAATALAFNIEYGYNDRPINRKNPKIKPPGVNHAGFKEDAVRLNKERELTKRLVASGNLQLLYKIGALVKKVK